MKWDFFFFFIIILIISRRRHAVFLRTARTGHSRFRSRPESTRRPSPGGAVSLAHTSNVSPDSAFQNPNASRRLCWGSIFGLYSTFNGTSPTPARGERPPVFGELHAALQPAALFLFRGRNRSGAAGRSAVAPRGRGGATDCPFVQLSVHFRNSKAALCCIRLRERPGLRGKRLSGARPRKEKIPLRKAEKGV